MLVMRFLNFYLSQVKQLAPGTRVRLFGEIRQGFFGAEMVHPRYRVVAAGEPLAKALTPVYPTTAGLSQYALRKLVLDALENAVLDDTLPEALRRRHALPGIAESIRSLHQPAPDAEAEELIGRSGDAWRRVKFDELLAQQLSMRIA